MTTKIALWAWRLFRCIFILVALLAALVYLHEFPGWVEGAWRAYAIGDGQVGFAWALLTQARKGAADAAALAAIWLAAVALKRTFTPET